MYYLIPPPSSFAVLHLRRTLPAFVNSSTLIVVRSIGLRIMTNTLNLPKELVWNWFRKEEVDESECGKNYLFVYVVNAFWQIQSNSIWYLIMYTFPARNPLLCYLTICSNHMISFSLSHISQTTAYCESIHYKSHGWFMLMWIHISHILYTYAKFQNNSRHLLLLFYFHIWQHLFTFLLFFTWI